MRCEVDTVVATEDDTREEGPHEEGGRGALRRRHEGKEEEEEDATAHRPLIIFGKLGGEVLVQELGQEQDHKGTPIDEKSERACNGHGNVPLLAST